MEGISEALKEVGLFLLFLFEKTITTILPIVKMYSFENLVKSIPGMFGFIITISIIVTKIRKKCT